MKIALVNCSLEHSEERQYAGRHEPHLGLASLAATLENRGMVPVVVDAKFEGMGFDHVMKKLVEAKPDLVGLTAFTPEIEDAASLARQVRKDIPDALVVIGGTHATILPARTMEEFLCFDFLVYGEGEDTLIELVMALEGKMALEQVKGLVYRSGGIKVNPPRAGVADLDTLPYPAWHLFSKSARYPLEASRGCPFKCKFCCRVTGNKVRLKSPQRIVEEMERLCDQYEPEHITFNDETFGVNKKHAFELLDLMISRGIGRRVGWNVTTRVSEVTPELAMKLKQAGCTSLGFGIESGNQAILNAVGKGITLEQAEKAIAITKKAGLRTNAFFILGHPNETKETARQTIDFAVKLNPTRVAFGIMVPYPGTEIAKMVENGEGNYRKLSTKWSDYGKQAGNAVELNTITRAELEQLQTLAYLKFYLYRPSLSKSMRLLREVGFRSLLAHGRHLVRKRLTRSSHKAEQAEVKV